MKQCFRISLIAALTTMLFGGVAEASYPAGVWVKPEAVQYEPSAEAPTRIRIVGAAMLYDGGTGTRYLGYTEPARGVLYYECPPAQSATCVDEWKDIVANLSAPLDVCVGLGDQSQPTGRLRPPGDTQNADAYPIHMGILPSIWPCTLIQQFLTSDIDAGGGGGGGSSAGAAGGTSAAGNGGTGGTGAGAGAPGSGGEQAGSSNGSSGKPARAAESSAVSADGCSLTVPRSSAGFVGVGLAVIGVALLRRRRG